MKSFFKKLPVIKDFWDWKERYHTYLTNVEKCVRIEYYERIHRLMLLRDVDYDGIDKWIRIGRKSDGGYVMLNDFGGISIAYSFGIGDEYSWDDDLSKHGIDVYMYDPYSVPDKIDNPRLHFSQIGIGGVDHADKGIFTLETLLKKNHHENEKNMILKIDIEGDEWPVLESLNIQTLSRFKQIVMEFHNIMRLDLCYAEFGLERLNSTHQLVHIHANSDNPVDEIGLNISFPLALEVTYLRRDSYTFVENKRYFPTDLDCANGSNPQINLGRWNEI